MLDSTPTSPSRKLSRQFIGEALKAGARTRKEVNKHYPFVASKGHEYECWRSEVSTWFGGKRGVKGASLEKSAIAIMHHAGRRLEFGKPAVDQLRQWIAAL